MLDGDQSRPSGLSGKSILYDLYDKPAAGGEPAARASNWKHQDSASAPDIHDAIAVHAQGGDRMAILFAHKSTVSTSGGQFDVGGRVNSFADF
jgi:hypothetical protein